MLIVLFIDVGMLSEFLIFIVSSHPYWKPAGVFTLLNKLALLNKVDHDHHRLQVLASELESHLSMCGLRIGSGPQRKSASPRLDIDSKARKWIVNPLPYLRIAEETVPSFSVSQVYRYLGVDVSPGCTKVNIAGMLRDGLAIISLAPLKPQQRLYITTHHLLPKCQHQLALAPA